MPRFYINPTEESRVLLCGPDALHIARSLRMKPGEALVLCDGQGSDYHGKILSVSPEQVAVEILDKCSSASEPSVQIHLFQALPKSDKMDFIVQKSVELGVHRIVPVLSSRCISRPDEKNADKKTARWQKIAAGAAKQSGRGILPAVDTVRPFAKALEEIESLSLGLFCYEKGGKPIKSVISSSFNTVGIFIGPEGGFSSEEAQLAKDKGWIHTSLGSRILRCETAPIAVLSALLYQTDNL